MARRPPRFIYLVQRRTRSKKLRIDRRRSKGTVHERPGLSRRVAGKGAERWPLRVRRAEVNHWRPAIHEHNRLTLGIRSVTNGTVHHTGLLRLRVGHCFLPIHGCGPSGICDSLVPTEVTLFMLRSTSAMLLVDPFLSWRSDCLGRSWMGRQCRRHAAPAGTVLTHGWHRDSCDIHGPVGEHG